MHTKTSGTRPSRRVALVILLGALAMAIPSSASGSYGFVSDEGTNREYPAASETRLVIPDHEALNDSLAPLSESNGAPASPLTVSTSSADKFDWADAALGAGIAMVLIGLGATGFLVVRRRMTVSPTASIS